MDIMSDSANQSATQHSATPGSHKFSSVPGFFEDFNEIAKSSPNGKLSTQPALGLIKRDYDGPDTDLGPDRGAASQWERFVGYIIHLNYQHMNDGISYKLVYVIRHGRGVHNEKMDKLKLSEKAGQLEIADGKPLNWNNHWSHKDGDGKVTWADAQLVETGIAQAQNLAKLWVDKDERDAPLVPWTLYTSPLARGLETTRLTYSPVMKKHGRPLRPIVVESLRERLTDHTCDRRSSRTWIEQNYPDYSIEEGFSELDASWDAGKSESPEQHIVRTQRMLDDIFENDASPVISLTTHSFTITTILAVLGYPKFLVNEGTLVPFLVKAERVTPKASPP
ncbi:phosphoglycerate mutase-like protein [Jackrogersella minutella]|nr:phosphoglycerate mutase-like protein [Jackrogersella minutella]